MLFQEEYFTASTTAFKKTDMDFLFLAVTYLSLLLLALLLQYKKSTLFFILLSFPIILNFFLGVSPSYFSIGCIIGACLLLLLALLLQYKKSTLFFILLSFPIILNFFLGVSPSYFSIGCIIGACLFWYSTKPAVLILALGLYFMCIRVFIPHFAPELFKYNKTVHQAVNDILQSRQFLFLLWGFILCVSAFLFRILHLNFLNTTKQFIRQSMN